jgi:hypothetical protein
MEYTFKKVEDTVYYENSYGVLAREDDVEMEYTVGINSEEYGWFEMYDTATGGEAWHAEGGLWFENKVLTDYDGVFELAPAIIEKLEELGYDCSQI